MFWDLQPLWPSSLTKPDLLRFWCTSGHVLSKTKSVTPHFFYVSDITNSSPFSGKIFRKKSMLEIFALTSFNLILLHLRNTFLRSVVCLLLLQSSRFRFHYSDQQLGYSLGQSQFQLGVSCSLPLDPVGPSPTPRQRLWSLI